MSGLFFRLLKKTQGWKLLKFSASGQSEVGNNFKNYVSWNFCLKNRIICTLCSAQESRKIVKDKNEKKPAPDIVFQTSLWANVIFACCMNGLSPIPPLLIFTFPTIPSSNIYLLSILFVNCERAKKPSSRKTLLYFVSISKAWNF